MRLWIDKLEIVSFKAYREKQVLNLKDLGTGLWFVEGRNLVSPRLGSNGAAKSTIWDCLCWVLYGKTVKGRPTTAVKTWGSKTPPEASVLLSVGDEPHTITRKGVANGLWLDGKTVTQDEIDRLIGLSWAIFLHTLVLGQGRELFFDLRPTAKMEVLSETLDLDKWDVRITRARRAADKWELAATRGAAELSSLQRELDASEVRLRDLKADSQAWENDRADEAQIIADKLRKLEDDYEHHKNELGKADLEYDGAETELRHSQRKFDEAKEKGREYITARADTTSRFDRACEQERTCKRALDGALKGDTCPVCNQPLDTHAQDELERELKRALRDAEDEVDRARREMYAAIDADEAFKSAEAAIGRDIRHFRDKSDSAIDKRTRSQSAVNELAAHIHALKNPTTQIVENPYTQMLHDARKADKALLAKEDDYKEVLRVATEQAALSKYWVEGFKNVRLYLIEDVLVELEEVTQNALAEVGLDDWRVEYDIEKDNKTGGSKPAISVYIFQPEYDDAVAWEDFSGGEGQRLRLVGAIALSEVLLRRAGVRCDLLVLDEPTRHLSPEGVRDTVDFLLDRSRDSQIFYVDHAATDSRRFAGSVRVTRDRDGARFFVDY